MPYKESVQSEDLKLYLNGASFFWNVSSSVGYTCRNQKEDVLLVQFFLNSIFLGLAADPNTNFIVKPPKQLVPDGDFGGKTWAAIKWMQQFNCVVDGMVSAKADGTQCMTPKQGKLYTIYELNGWYIEYHPTKFQDLRQDPTLPSVLCSHLSGPMPNFD